MTMKRLREALARWRVTLGFVSGVLVLWLAEPTRGSLAAGALVALAGESLRIWAAGHLRKSVEVTTSGPYRWLAHPLYVGSAILGAGLAIACANLIVAVLIASYLGATLTAAIREEEAFLGQSFGDRYGRYLCGSSSADGGMSRRFSVSRAVANREHRAVAGVVAALLLLAFKAGYRGL
jgi:protein-S-isoprenylcysteine O-methyltransferase Ste14